MTFRPQDSVGAVHRVLEPDRRLPDARDARGDPENLVVACRRPVTAPALRDDQEYPALLEIAVGKAPLTEQLRAALFEIKEIVRVVHDAHLVGLAIPDADRVGVLDHFRAAI